MPMLAKASPHAVMLRLPPARSSTKPNTSGARQAELNPMKEYTAIIAPRVSGGADAIAPDVSAAESPSMRP